MDQNLISASISPEELISINEAIKTLKEKMPFLSTLQKAEIGGLFKVGNNYQPFLDLAKQVKDAHPEILSGVFNKDEFDKDYALFKAIQPIGQQINQINEGLEIYAAVKQNKDKVPGLSVTYEAMAAFFKRSRIKSATT